MMGKKAAFLLLFAVAATGSALSSHLVPLDLPHPFVSDSVELLFLAVWTFLAMPIAFWMPLMRARFFAPLAKVPSRTYLLPATVIQLILFFLAGQVFGLLVVGLMDDGRVLWLCCSDLLTLLCFYAGARKRFRQTREFEMPFWPPGMMIRWSARRFGWRLQK